MASDPALWSTHRCVSPPYTVQHPPDWKAEREEDALNINPEDDSGAVTISSFQGPPPIPDFPAVWLQDTFEKETPTSDLLRITGRGWSEVKRAFVDPESGREWIGIVASRGNVFVLMTANDEPESMARRRATYERILDSLQLGGPA
jgi:hypothetical protein